MAICLDGKVLNAIINTYIAGKTAKDKHLSNASWARNNLFLREVLQGYLQGDGHWDMDNKRWRIGFTRNYNLESDLRTICARLGYNLTCNLATSKIGSKRYDSFKGEIRQETTVKGHWNQKNKGEIIEIRKARARYFYDIGVEDEPFLFSLASGILTHNSKPNPMPESVTDRPTKSHEYMFLLTKSAKYYYDADAVKEPVQSGPSDIKKMIESKDRIGGKHKTLVDPLSKASSTTNIGKKRSVGGTLIHGNIPGRDDNGHACNNPNQLYRNKRSVWTIPTQPYPEAHFAVFPEKLIEPCILAGSRIGDTVLDPFGGSGTTARVLKRLNRKAVLVELNPEYCEMAKVSLRQGVFQFQEAVK